MIQTLCLILSKPIKNRFQVDKSQNTLDQTELFHSQTISSHLTPHTDLLPLMRDH